LVSGSAFSVDLVEHFEHVYLSKQRQKDYVLSYKQDHSQPSNTQTHYTSFTYCHSCQQNAPYSAIKIYLRRFIAETVDIEKTNNLVCTAVAISLYNVATNMHGYVNVRPIYRGTLF